MPSQIKENYLKAIYFISQKNVEISITELSKQMGVSKPTANNMVKKMEEKSWLIYQKYKPIKLTAKGKKIAIHVIRKHRLTEMFLAKIMGFGWEEVHDIAEEMEHLQSEKLFDRMDEILGFPTIDPHGSPIPDKKGKVIEANYRNLSTISEGGNVKLCALTNSSKDLLLFLNKKNIQLGTEIKIEEREPFDKSLKVVLNNNLEIILTFEVAKCLLVEPV